MSDLNIKNIDYGALNRFYQNLKSNDLDIRTIKNIDTLPDAEENKDSVFRLSSNKQVYISKGTLITPTNRLPDKEQIGKALLCTREWTPESMKGESHYYNGSYTITCADGVLNWYAWCTSDGGLFVTEDNAETITYSTKLAYVNGANWSNKTTTGVTTTLTVNEVKSLSTVGTYPHLCLLFLYLTASEEDMIGNAYLLDFYNNRCFYTGEIANILGKDYYLWKTKNNLWAASEKPASEIYVNNDEETGIYSCFVYKYNPSTNTISEGKTFWGDGYSFIPKLNAPDSEQVGHTQLKYGWNNTYTYKGEETTIQIDGNDVTVYIWQHNGDDTVIYSTKRASEVYVEPNLSISDIISVGGTPNVHFYIDNNGTIEEITDVWLTEFSPVKYQRTYNWNWQRVVTEDELYPNESTFTGATLTVDGSQPSIVASGSTTIVWDDLASSIPSGKTVEVSVVLINTGNSALTPTMSGNYQMMGDGNLTIQAGELGLYRGRYISALNKWLIEAIYQEVSGIME